MMRWPLSALLVWLGALAPWWLLHGPLAVGLSLAILGAGAWWHGRAWRRAIVLAGAPLALLLQHGSVPPWTWAALAALLLALYPLRRWGDAPLFLTPARAFADLPGHLRLADGDRVLDAGCGSGAALRAWRLAYPGVRLVGIEASWPLVVWARMRCPWADVRQGDFWNESWRDYRVIYLFQRPETMARALDKARRELPPGAHLVSLDFPLPGVEAAITLPVGRHCVLVYAAEALN